MMTWYLIKHKDNFTFTFLFAFRNISDLNSFDTETYSCNVVICFQMLA
jgi:hypothetical protein